MIFTHDSDHFEIAPSARAPEEVPETAYDDMLFDVGVRCMGFTGADHVWVSPNDWQSFVQAFRELEQRRRGAAELLGVVPEEFRLRFQVYDLAGHVWLQGHMLRPSWLPGRSVRLDFHLEVDAGMLPAALREFQLVRHAT
ncbi:MAG TPA: hypothetical protein VFI41_00775 [Gemmatimonadales bacterium]|jgi:hypothetical protein|nr:hypothetical protein [Gemmatimonadales bacterium]